MNLREIILGVAVIILTMFVTTYGVNMFYNEPVYEDYCPSTLWQVNVMNETQCFDLGGKWAPQPIKCITEPCPQGYCENDFNCRQNYELANERYSMNIFLIAVPLGILLILFGAYFFSLNAVGIGIMTGGVGTLLRGVGSYWRYSEDWIRFLISLVGLGIVIYFSYRFKEMFGLSSHDSKKKGKKK